MDNNFKDAVKKIDASCAVWMTYESFNTYIKSSRVYLDKLKETEARLSDRDRNDFETRSNSYFGNLIPCIVDIKAAIECLKMSLAIKYSDEKFFDWSATLQKIETELGYSTSHLTEIESEIRDIRNFLIHTGIPMFGYSTQTKKFQLPKYVRLHRRLTIPNASDGQLEIVSLLENTLEKMDGLCDHLKKKTKYFQLEGHPVISEYWLKFGV